MRAVCSIAAGLFVMLIGSSVWAAACDGFADVDSTSGFCGAVSYVKDRGVTLGCTDASHYCPNDPVTRLQMAAFLQRMGRADPSNTLGDHTSSIGGGINNVSDGISSSISGGSFNHATASYASVAGGGFNTAGGIGSFVAGGLSNMAGGDYSFVAGQSATAAENGMFVWADSQGPGFDPTTFRPADQSRDTFNVRATGVGGVYFVTGINPSTGTPTWGCYAQNGGGWTCTSDRNVKRNIVPVDGQHVLDQLAAMPIYHWQPKDGPHMANRHVGPMAQDFYATFGLGDDDKAIGMQDAEGIALAAIQGLNAKLEATVAGQAHELAELRARVANIEHATGH